MVPVFIVPDGWNKPTAEMVAVVKQASEQFEVPEEILFGIIRKESNFKTKLDGYKHGGNSEMFRKSYERYKDKVIPGKNPQKITWGMMFKTPESWRPRGLTQIMPYHIVGKAGGVAPGAPLSDLYDVPKVIRLAAAYLKALHDKNANWTEAVRIYNGSASYARQVAAYMVELKKAQGTA